MQPAIPPRRPSAIARLPVLAALLAALFAGSPEVAAQKAKRPPPGCPAPAADGAGETAFWKGSCVKKQPTGRGILVWSRDGQVLREFEGELADGQPAGPGVLRWPDGRRYEGGIAGGQPAGPGVLALPDGDRIEAGFTAGLAEGPGTLLRADGTRIEATFKGGEIEGPAVVRFAGAGTGLRYEGPLRERQPDGAGTIHTAAGHRYAAVFRDGTLVSTGEFIFADGTRYRGPLVDHLPQGDGQLTRADGETVEGRFEAGQPAGRATVRFPDGRRYDGAVDAAGRPHGEGRLIAPDGIRWVGRFAEGRPSAEVRLWLPGGPVYRGAFDAAGPAGAGELVLAGGERVAGRFSGIAVDGAKLAYPDGDRYEGGLADFRPQGQGTLETAAGNRYAGSFRAGRPQGRAEVRHTSGASYAGELLGGRRNGQGVFVAADGTRYEGRFAAGVPDGPGRLVLAGGMRYEGAFRAGLPDGMGRLDYGDGTVYEGELRAGRPSGKGTVVTRNGTRFEGHFAGGLRDGPGILVTADGDRKALAFFADLPEKDEGPFFGVFRNRFEELGALLDGGFALWAQRYYLAHRRDVDDKPAQAEPLLARLRAAVARPQAWREGLLRLRTEFDLADAGRFASVDELESARRTIDELERLAAARRAAPLPSPADPALPAAGIERLRAQLAGAAAAQATHLLGRGALDEAADLIGRFGAVGSQAPAAGAALNAWVAAHPSRAAERRAALGQLATAGLTIDKAALVAQWGPRVDDLLLLGETAAAQALANAAAALQIELLDARRAGALAGALPPASAGAAPARP